MFSKTNLKNQLNKSDFTPNKLLGQNFLVDQNVLKKILAAADLKKSEMVLEIGPGRGILTQELAERAGRVIAVEKDEKLAEILKEKFKDAENVEIVQDDILSFLRKPAYRTGRQESKNRIPHPAVAKAMADKQVRDDKHNNSMLQADYKVVANIPYYLTSHLIRILLESKNQPKEMILMIQKEVAQRICAKPPKMSLLAASVQFYAKPKIISFVSKKSFRPSPKVDSAIIKIIPYSRHPELVSGSLCWIPKQVRDDEMEPKKFFDLVKAGFSQPRKQLANNLSKKLKISKETILALLKSAQIEPTQRAETLSMDDWLKILQNLSKP